MKINIQWTETVYYNEEVEAPDNLNEEELGNWVNDIYLEEVWSNASPVHTDRDDIEWEKA